jgi:hypothetical protein
MMRAAQKKHDEPKTLDALKTRDEPKTHDAQRTNAAPKTRDVRRMRAGPKTNAAGNNKGRHPSEAPRPSAGLRRHRPEAGRRDDRRRFRRPLKQNRER